MGRHATMLSVLYFLLLAVHSVSAHTFKYRDPDSSDSPQGRVLHPTVHPSLDTTDPIHVLTSEGKSLHYHDPHAVASAVQSFATVNISAFIHPVVVLEHSASVISVKCEYDTTTITVAFKDRFTWSMAVEDWKRHNQFLIVAFVDSCGLGRDPRERSVHAVKNIRASAQKLEIIGDMDDLLLSDAIHPDHVVTIDIDAFDIHSSAAPLHSTHLRRQEADADTNGGQSSPESSGSNDPSTTTQDSTASSLLDLLKMDEADTDYIPSNQIEDDYWFDRLLPTSPDAIGDTDTQRNSKRNCIDRAPWGPFGILIGCIMDGVARLILPPKKYDRYMELSDFRTIGDGILAAAATYIATRLLENSPGGEVSFDTNDLLPMRNTEEFGLAYKVIEFTDNSIKDARGTGLVGSIGLYCVGCRLHGYIKQSSRYEFVMNERKLRKGEVRLGEGQIDLSVGVGVAFDATFNGAIVSHNVGEIPLTPLTILGLIVVGPYISIDAGLDVHFQGKGTILSRTSKSWSHVSSDVSLVGGRSAIGTWNLTRNEKLTNVNLTSGTAGLTPYVSTSFLVGVSILKGKFKIGGGVVIKVSLPMIISTSTANDPGGCSGLNVSVIATLNIDAVVTAGPLGKTYGIVNFTETKYTKCLPIAEALEQAYRLTFGGDQDLLPFEPDNADLALVTMGAKLQTGQELVVTWEPHPFDGLLVLAPPNVLDFEATITQAFVSAKSLNATPATVGSFDGRVMTYNTEIMKKYGVSFPQLNTRHTVPRINHIVGMLKLQPEQNGNPAFVYGSNSAGEVFYTGVCLIDRLNYTTNKYEDSPQLAFFRDVNGSCS
ncbi:hypothetical protein B0H19DRAFT_1161426 [Mycena capillaripes]|nr:hypothetical protein B0H19DRAFT_1161426 [Mycena capillaripes]